MHTDQPINMTNDELMKQGIAFHKSAEFAKAESFYLAVLKTEPGHAMANQSMGILLVQQNRAEEGLPYFVAALNADPAQGQYWLNYIDALFQAGHIVEAQQTLSLAKEYGLQGGMVEELAVRLQDASVPQGKRARPSDQEMEELVNLFGQRKYELAANLAAKMTREFPQHEFGWKALGVTYKEMGRNEDALMPMQRASALSPRDVEVHYNLGVILQDLHRLDEAQESYQKALSIEPGYVDAHVNLGVVLQNAGRLQEALSCFDRVLKLNPDDIVACYNLGCVQKDLGRLADAAGSFRRTLQIKPDHVDAHCSLGAVLMELYQPVEAEMNFRQAIKIKPDHGEAYFGLGRALKEQERFDEAEAAYRKALRFNPDNANVHYNLGNLLKDKERMDEAEACYRQAIEYDSSIAQAHYNLGNILLDSERLEEAETYFRQALELKSDYAEALCNLGMVLHKTDRLDEAEVCYQRALRIKPDFADVFLFQGLILFKKGCHIESEAIYRQALKINPEFAEAHCNLGSVLFELRRFEDAEASLRRALQIKPDFAAAYTNLGIVFMETGRLIEAEAACQKALQIEPDYAEGSMNLGIVLMHLGRLDEAETCLRRAIEIKPDYVGAHSNLLFMLNYNQEKTPEENFREAQAYSGRIGHLVKQRYTSWSSEGQRLRIGFVSGDLKNHPVGYFIEGLLAHLDRNAFELIAYPTVPHVDASTVRIKSYFSAWKPFFGMDDEAAAALIHDDRIHILIDLAGHTRYNRLPVFARKPAPVQVSWLGYFATTGLKEMDYLIADAHTLPESIEQYFTEKIWRLPETRLCFTPPDMDVPVSTLPALRNGYVTFGCFNNLTKMNDKVVELWSRIMTSVPNSRLFLKTKQLNEAAIRQHTAERFAAHKIDASRLIMESTESREKYFAAYNRVDISLDPFPYPGGTTTVESLWMGVPVLTLNGESFLSRQGVGILMNSGLADWIANDAEEYVARAASYAQDLGQLSTLRLNLRQQVLASPIMDGKRFAEHFGNALRGMWQKWCVKR